LQTLIEHQLYVKFSKCEFYKDQIQYLGHVISAQGIAVDPGKIKATTDWLIPQNVSDIHSFMGLAGYYRRLLQIFQR